MYLYDDMCPFLYVFDKVLKSDREHMPGFGSDGCLCNFGIQSHHVSICADSFILLKKPSPLTLSFLQHNLLKYLFSIRENRKHVGLRGKYKSCACPYINTHA